MSQSLYKSPLSPSAKARGVQEIVAESFWQTVVDTEESAVAVGLVVEGPFNGPSTDGPVERLDS